MSNNENDNDYYDVEEEIARPEASKEAILEEKPYSEGVSPAIQSIDEAYAAEDGYAYAGTSPNKEDSTVSVNSAEKDAGYDDKIEVTNNSAKKPPQGKSRRVFSEQALDIAKQLSSNPPSMPPILKLPSNMTADELSLVDMQMIKKEFDKQFKEYINLQRKQMATTPQDSVDENALDRFNLPEKIVALYFAFIDDALLKDGNGIFRQYNKKEFEDARKQYWFAAPNSYSCDITDEGERVFYSIKSGDPIAKGNFGAFKMATDKDGGLVGFKRLKFTSMEAYNKSEAKREIECLKVMGELKNHAVKINDKGEIIVKILQTFHQGKMLKDCLPRSGSPQSSLSDEGGSKPFSTAVQDLSLEQKMEFAKLLVQRAMELHEHGIIHMDLKSDNIMVDISSEGVVKNVAIIDFGLSVMHQDEAGKPQPIDGSTQIPFGIKAAVPKACYGLIGGSVKERCEDGVSELFQQSKRNGTVCAKTDIYQLGHLFKELGLDPQLYAVMTEENRAWRASGQEVLEYLDNPVALAEKAAAVMQLNQDRVTHYQAALGCLSSMKKTILEKDIPALQKRLFDELTLGADLGHRDSQLLLAQCMLDIRWSESAFMYNKTKYPTVLSHLATQDNLKWAHNILVECASETSLMQEKAYPLFDSLSLEASIAFNGKLSDAKQLSEVAECLSDLDANQIRSIAWRSYYKTNQSSDVTPQALLSKFIETYKVDDVASVLSKAVTLLNEPNAASLMQGIGADSPEMTFLQNMGCDQTIKDLAMQTEATPSRLSSRERLADELDRPQALAKHEKKS